MLRAYRNTFSIFPWKILLLPDFCFTTDYLICNLYILGDLLVYRNRIICPCIKKGKADGLFFGSDEQSPD